MKYCFVGENEYDLAESILESAQDCQVSVIADRFDIESILKAIVKTSYEEIQLEEVVLEDVYDNFDDTYVLHCYDGSITVGKYKGGVINTDALYFDSNCISYEEVADRHKVSDFTVQFSLCEESFEDECCDCGHCTCCEDKVDELAEEKERFKELIEELIDMCF